MSVPLEDYALIGDCQSAALVSKGGSIDWLCLPRFDSDACFAALLGTPENGRWLLEPSEAVTESARQYRGGTLILETRFRTAEGEVTVIDFMPPRGDAPDVVRIVVGVRGSVRMRSEVVIRCGYGAITPWVQRSESGIVAVAGPDRLRLTTTVPLRGEGYKTVAEFTVREGERIPFVLTWSPSYQPLPDDVNPEAALAETDSFWRVWVDRCAHGGEWDTLVRRSLVTLKALTYAPTGGIVAAPTTSLPEALGGSRNWDYRYCWLRDATFTIYALVHAGYNDEAIAWRDWLLRAIAGDPAKLQILYGLRGERRVDEAELPWLAGYDASLPVRIGNAASGQLQLDVYGEVADALYSSRKAGLPGTSYDWNLQRALTQFLEDAWKQPDEGLWEVRGPRRHFTHSKVMAWVAFDRGVRSIEEFGLPGPLERWRAIRDEIHETVCRLGFDAEMGSFAQSFGARELDASLLLIPLVGFLPADDPRVKGTVLAIESYLLQDGLVLRYPTRHELDGLPPGEGVFLACSFWLVDNYILQGRTEDAMALFRRLAALTNDLGLLAEEYDPVARRLVGNFPQAFSHVALVNSARNLMAALASELEPTAAPAESPATRRSAPPPHSTAT